MTERTRVTPSSDQGAKYGILVDPNEFEVRKARKTYRCQHSGREVYVRHGGPCDRVIEPGDVYVVCPIELFMSDAHLSLPCALEFGIAEASDG